jgi:hypothetical protein
MIVLAIHTLLLAAPILIGAVLGSLYMRWTHLPRPTRLSNLRITLLPHDLRKNEIGFAHDANLPLRLTPRRWLFVRSTRLSKPTRLSNLTITLLPNDLRESDIGFAYDVNPPFRLTPGSFDDHLSPDAARIIDDDPFLKSTWKDAHQTLHRLYAVLGPPPMKSLLRARND